MKQDYIRFFPGRFLLKVEKQRKKRSCLFICQCIFLLIEQKNSKIQDSPQILCAYYPAEVSGITRKKNNGCKRIKAVKRIKVMKRILAIKKNKSSEKNNRNIEIGCGYTGSAAGFSIIDGIIYGPPEVIYMGRRKHYIWPAGGIICIIVGLPAGSGMVFRREGQISDR